MDISLVKARNRNTVSKIFKNRCALNPAHSGYQIHEIVPKSRKKDWWVIGNQVLLCQDCHDRIHTEGTKAYEDKLVLKLWALLLQEIDFQTLINMIDS